MKEDMFEVLMYLFENYYMEEDAGHNPDRESLHGELIDAGFTPVEISQAFDWLEDLSSQQGIAPAHFQTNTAVRVFSKDECDRFDVECRGFLLFLEQMGILTPVSRERVIERVMALKTEDFDLSQLKWVILMVLFNQPGEEAAYAWMEDLVFDSLSGYLH